MTTEKLISQIEAYFGPYPNETVKAYTGKYLAEFPEANRSKLYAEILKGHLLTYGTPGIAEIERVHKKYSEGNTSLKAKPISSCAPVEEYIPTEEELNAGIAQLTQEPLMAQVLAKLGRNDDMGGPDGLSGSGER